MTTKPILCTLFDSAYLLKGMALLESLREQQATFEMFVLAMDERVERTVRSLADPRIAVLSATEIISPELQAVLDGRNVSERMWTMTPIWMDWLFQNLKKGGVSLHDLTYLDADSYLFAPLDSVYREIATQDVAIVPHRFPERLCWREQHNGVYNVNFVYIANTKRGTACLHRWAVQCFDWCYQRTERAQDGTLLFGDQGYLDTWGKDYGAHAVRHIGVNLAPWNQERFFYTWDQQLYVIERDPATAGGVSRINPLLLYHFHDFNVDASRVKYGGYQKVLKPEVLEHIYAPYIKRLLELESRLA